jgi:hypothetical protein
MFIVLREGYNLASVYEILSFKAEALFGFSAEVDVHAVKISDPADFLPVDLLQS